MTIENMMMACTNITLKTKFNVYHNGILMWSNEYYGLPEGIRDKHQIRMFNINFEEDSCDIILM
jgi:hypothetical protein